MPPILWSLGPWRIRATAILRKRGRRRLRQFLLLPPSGFTGRVRLSVISGRRREEFVAAWTDGVDPALTIDERQHLQRMTGSLFLPPADREALDATEGEIEQDAPAPPMRESPAVFSVPVEDRSARTSTGFDLLLETIPEEEQDATGGSPPLSGSLAHQSPPSGAVLYLAPILEPPPAASEARGELLAAALSALRRDDALRLSIGEEWGEEIQTRGLGKTVDRHIGTGQLEILATSAEVRAGGFHPAFPPRCGLLTPDGAEVDVDPLLSRGLRGLLLITRGPELLHSLAPRREVGFAFHLHTARRGVPAHLARPMSCRDPLADQDAAYTVSLVQQVLRESMRVAAPRRARPSEMRRLNLCPLPAGDPELWPQLARRVKRWNRGHLSPRIVLVTLSDYFTTVTELEDRRMIHPRPIL